MVSRWAVMQILIKGPDTDNKIRKPERINIIFFLNKTMIFGENSYGFIYTFPHSESL